MGVYWTLSSRRAWWLIRAVNKEALEEQCRSKSQPVSSPTDQPQHITASDEKKCELVHMEEPLQGYWLGRLFLLPATVGLHIKSHPPVAQIHPHLLLTCTSGSLRVVTHAAAETPSQSEGLQRVLRQIDSTAYAQTPKQQRQLQLPLSKCTLNRKAPKSLPELHSLQRWRGDGPKRLPDSTACFMTIIKSRTKTFHKHLLWQTTLRALLVAELISGWSADCPSYPPPPPQPRSWHSLVGKTEAEKSFPALTSPRSTLSKITAAFLTASTGKLRSE